MSRLPTISVAILNYNYCCYLEQALESVYGQSCGNFVLEEVVVHDDGSTDGSVQYLRRNWPEVSLRAHENAGFGANLTRAVAGARGDWVALLDADDFWRVDRLATIAEAFADGVGLVMDKRSVLDEIDDGLARPNELPAGSTSTLVARTAWAKDVLPITNEIGLLNLWPLSSGIEIGRALTVYRIHEKSMTDRTEPGAYRSYFSEVCLEAEASLRMMATPAWSTPAKHRRLLLSLRRRAEESARMASEQKQSGRLDEVF